MFRIYGLIQLPARGVDLEVREQRLHSEGTGLIRNDRNDSFSQPLVPHDLSQQPDERHGSCDILVRSSRELFVEIVLRKIKCLGYNAALRHQSTKSVPAGEQVLNLLGIRARVVEGRNAFTDVLIGYGQLES